MRTLTSAPMGARTCVDAISNPPRPLPMAASDGTDSGVAIFMGA